MKKQESNLRRAPEGAKKSVDWAKVVEVIITILTIGLNHIKKHKKS